MGIVASTVIAAIGINIYSQSYGFYQFYSAPLMMAFPAMAAILIGGAHRKSKRIQCGPGVILKSFQCLLTLATPVANAVINAGISEVVRIIVRTASCTH